MPLKKQGKMSWFGILFGELFVDYVDSPDYLRKQADQSRMNGRELAEWLAGQGYYADVPGLERMSRDEVHDNADSIYQ